ncbi:unnamed protein product [Alopecurus aequalis]
MRLTMAPLVLAIIALGVSGVGANVDTICKAASDKDELVGYQFCITLLANSNGDAWGLAKAAAYLGVKSTYIAIKDIKGLLAKLGTDAKKKAVLEQCNGFYGSIKFAFANARDRINKRNYAAGKEEATKAISLAHQCDDILETAIVPSPLWQQSFSSIQTTIVCRAITNLIE